MGRYSLLAVFEKEPAVIAGTIKSLLMVGVLVGLLEMDEYALAGIALALELVLTLFVRGASTPNVNVNTATQTTTVTTEKVEED